jgi:L-ribulokinase
MDLFPQMNKEEKQKHIEQQLNDVLKSITQAAEKIPVGQNQVLALDWINGRRTPDANQHLSMAIAGLTMSTDAPALFRACVEATACGSQAIIKRLEREGVAIERIVAIGGIPKKSAFVMQTCADLWQKKVDVVGSEQCCALGTAMFASVVAGIHKDITEAQESMHSGISQTFTPNSSLASEYQKVFERYQKFGDEMEQFTQTEIQK